MTKTSREKRRSVCMIAYANYFTDARIKNYVDILLKNGYTVDVFALGDPEPTPPGLRVFCLMSKVWSKSVLPYLISQTWFLLLAAWRAGLEFARQRYVLIHVHNMPDFLVFAALIPRAFRARLILDVHDTMPEFYATKYDLALDHPAVRLLKLEERWSAAFADHVITTNVLHREALVENGIPAGKISIIMNLGNPAIFHPRPKPAASSGLCLGYHGTVAERLGLDLILAAMRLARASCPGLRLELIGDGEFMPEVRRLVTEYALEDIVCLRGWMPVEELPRYLSRVDVGIIGIRSRYERRRNWGLPVKMLEYAAMEIPAIAPRLRVIREYFDNHSAFYYTPDDIEDMARRIREIYQQPGEIAAASEHLREFNKRHSWQEAETEYLANITALVSDE